MSINNTVSVNYASILWLNSRQSAVKPSTLSTYSRIVFSHIIPDIGDSLLCELDSDFIRNYADFLLTSGRCDGSGSLSLHSVHDIIRLLYSILRFARNEGAELPVSGDFNVRYEHKIMRVFTPEEQRRFSEFLILDGSLSALGILICLYSGLRIGEICALKWDCIDLENGILRVERTIQRIQTQDDSDSKTAVIIASPKTRSSVRIIPIQEFILNLLICRRASQDCFFLTGSSSFIEPRTLQYRFKKMLSRCGIRDANFHALRHSFATRCVEVGLDAKTLSEILGHSNVNITLNLYVHSSVEQKRNGMSKLSVFMK